MREQILDLPVREFKAGKRILFVPEKFNPDVAAHLREGLVHASAAIGRVCGSPENRQRFHRRDGGMPVDLMKQGLRLGIVPIRACHLGQIYQLAPTWTVIRIRKVPVVVVLARLCIDPPPPLRVEKITIETGSENNRHVANRFKSIHSQTLYTRTARNLLAQSVRLAQKEKRLRIFFVSKTLLCRFSLQCMLSMSAPGVQTPFGVCGFIEMT